MIEKLKKIFRKQKVTEDIPEVPYTTLKDLSFAMVAVLRKNGYKGKAMIEVSDEGYQWIQLETTSENWYKSAGTGTWIYTNLDKNGRAVVRREPQNEMIGEDLWQTK